jgi:antirestriction protein ArdC
VGIESVSYEDTLTISVLVESSLFTSEQMDGIPEIVYRELDNLLVEAASTKDLEKDQDRLLDDL